MKFGNLAAAIAALARMAPVDEQSRPEQPTPSLDDLKNAFAALNVPGVSYPGQQKYRRMIAQGYRDVYSPEWRAWAKLKPIVARR